MRLQLRLLFFCSIEIFLSRPKQRCKHVRTTYGLINLEKTVINMDKCTVSTDKIDYFEHVSVLGQLKIASPMMDTIYGVQNLKRFTSCKRSLAFLTLTEGSFLELSATQRLWTTNDVKKNWEAVPSWLLMTSIHWKFKVKDFTAFLLHFRDKIPYNAIYQLVLTQIGCIMMQD